MHLPVLAFAVALYQAALASYLPQIHQTQLNSAIRDVVWCGSSLVLTRDDEQVEQEGIVHGKVLYLLTSNGTVSMSLNHGSSWESVQDINENNSFIDIQVSPADSRYIYFISKTGKSVMTTNCGVTYALFTHDPTFTDFKFNKMNTNWIIAYQPDICESDDSCVTSYKYTLFGTSDGGKVWKALVQQVKEATWDKLLERDDVPDERIIVCHLKDSNSQLSYSDDLFETQMIIYTPAFGFFQSSSYLFVLTKKDEDYTLVYSDSDLNNFLPNTLELPLEFAEQYKFTILDTSEGQMFLSVSHNEQNQKLTNIYVSNAEGKDFTLSLLNNVRSLSNGNCDFERIQGLHDVYIANFYEHQEVEKMKNRRTEDPELLEPYMRSAISFDRAATWHSLSAPSVDIDGNDIACAGECSLHLRGRTEPDHNPPYSVQQAPGIIIGVGNYGLYLSQNASELSTFISRDGGVTWKQIALGSYKSEISDRGGLIVLVRDDIMTDSFLYSWDHGLSWQKEQLGYLLDISNIQTEPSQTEAQLVIYGDKDNSTYLVSLDFSTLHQRQCDGAWDLTMPETDYESWTVQPQLGSDGCVNGRVYRYVRRKQSSNCFMKEEVEQASTEECECTVKDWVCASGYYRKMEMGMCIPEDQPEYTEPPKVCNETYIKYQGNRKAPGNLCVRGIDLSPNYQSCPKEADTKLDDLKDQEMIVEHTEPPKSFFMVIFVSFVGVIIIVIVWTKKKQQTLANSGGTRSYQELNHVRGREETEDEEEMLQL